MLKNILRSCSLFLCSIFLLYILVVGSLRIFLPNSLVFMKGKTTEISSPIPVSAKTTSDNISKEVLSVTTNPLASPFNLSLSSQIIANPLDIGNSNITFYLCNSLPIKTVSATVIESKTLIPMGQSVGITLDTNGLLVLGTGKVAVYEGDNMSTSDNSLREPAKGIIKTGDLLQKANNIALTNKEILQEIVANCNGEPIDFLIERDGKTIFQSVEPVFSPLENQYKIGIWVRDSIQGIGTITYYDPETNDFGALGHGVYDIDTGELMPMKQGTLISSNLTEIVRGEKGAPGELTGTIEKDVVLGEVFVNTPLGIYGTMNSSLNSSNQPLEIAMKHEVTIGKASILSNIEGNEVKSYEIEIQNLKGESGKEMRIQITDDELLSKTGGIIQGMSGSPIIQNGKIVGAVTHVFVNDPTKGYGIFIENMLSAKENDLSEVS